MAEYPARTANNEARRRLVAEYPERFRQLQAEEYAKAGIELPKTDREKAQEKLSAILEKHPDLATGAILAAESVASEAAYEAERDTGAPPADPEPEPGIDDAELPEGHELFGVTEGSNT